MGGVGLNKMDDEPLNDAVIPQERISLGDLLEDIGRLVNLTDEEMELFQRDKSPAPAANFD